MKKRINITPNRALTLLLVFLGTFGLQPAWSQNTGNSPANPDTSTSNGPDVKYMQAMGKQMQILGASKTATDFVNASNGFKRIAEAEKTKWIPYYYAAFTTIMAGLNEVSTVPSKGDQYADEAEAMIQKAEAIQKDQVEIILLKKMVVTLRMLVDPMNRYMQLSGQGDALLAKAKSLDPKNPRAALLEAQDLYNTPEQFGGDKKKAVEIMKQAMPGFDVPAPEPFYPNWGKQQAEQMIK